MLASGKGSELPTIRNWPFAGAPILRLLRPRLGCLVIALVAVEHGGALIVGEHGEPAGVLVIMMFVSATGYLGITHVGSDFEGYAQRVSVVDAVSDIDREFLSYRRLVREVETIAVPRDVLVVCVGKSTYARCGIIVNVTPLEPEWRGKVTIEISNTTPLPAKIYAGEGIAQMIFLKADRVCATSYADKGGKYQDQAGLTLPMVD